MNGKQYIFGYGSLIERSSRTRTTPAAEHAYPVIVRGLERGWWVRGSEIGFSTTFLAIRPANQEDAIVNGVIYDVSRDELIATDQRERSYVRSEIPTSTIELLDPTLDITGQCRIWAYVLPTTEAHDHTPNKRFPIVQSYVDLCLNGCLEIEEEFVMARERGFADLFVQTTQDWNMHWVNDRLFPRRPFATLPRAGRIDTTLHTVIPQWFNQIRIE